MLVLKTELLANIAKRFTNMEVNFLLTVGTLLDPCFKKVTFSDTSKYQPALEGEVAACASCVQQDATNFVENLPLPCICFGHLLILE